MRWPWSTHPVCRICGRPMAVEVVRYPARNGEGRPLVWVGVRRYYCPEGCSTAFYDFKKARLVGPGASDARTQALQNAAWTLTTLYVAVGLVLLYALFMYGAAVVPVPGWAHWLLWVLVTAMFAAIAALLVIPPRSQAPAVQPPAGEGMAQGATAQTSGAEAAASAASRQAGQ